MALTALPEEVLEAILLYVNAVDVLNVLTVVGSEVSEGFWRRISLKNGYRKSYEGEKWKFVFHRNMNWLKGRFVEEEYNFNDFSEGNDPSRNETSRNSGSETTRNLHDSNPSSSSSQDFKQSLFLKCHKILSQEPNELLIRNVESPTKILQTLPGFNVDWCNQSSTKLLLRTSSSLTVYSFDQGHYERMFVWNNDFPKTLYFLTDDYFLGLESVRKCITVVDLNIMEEYSRLFVSEGKPFSVFVQDRILNLIWLDGHKYVMRRYDLQRKEELEDVQLDKSATAVSIPQIKINERVLVSWTSTLYNGSTSLKIWTFQDQGSPSFNLIWGKYLGKSEHILWLLLDTYYVIYSTALTNSFFILDVRIPEKLLSMSMREKDYLGQNIVAGLLVLSYANCFKLVDFKNATYLYMILFKSGCEFDRFCVNESFYVVYNASQTKSNNTICVYNFRGELLKHN